MTMTDTRTCPAGHPLEGPDADVYVHPTGRLICRPCRRDSARRNRTPRTARTTLPARIERGCWVKAAGLTGVYRVHDVDDRGQVNVYGGNAHRRQYHTFMLDRLTITRPPEWARELPDPTAR